MESLRTAVALALVAVVDIVTSSSLAASAPDETGGVTRQQIQKAIGLSGSNDDESGLTLKLGIAFGQDQGDGLNGVRLAVAQIQAAGGPSIDLVVEDIGGPGRWSGAAAETALHDEGSSVVLVSEGAAGGTMVEGLERDHILAFDGDLGVTGNLRGRPYLWGLRPSVPDDDFPVGLQYLSEAYPKARSIDLVYPSNTFDPDAIVKSFTQALTDDGLSFDKALPVDPDQDAALAPFIQQSHPDAILAVGDVVTEVAQAASGLGLQVPVIGSALVSPSLGASKYLMATDWFDPTQVDNDWATLFVASYRARFGRDPSTSAANAYEDTFAIWTLVRRVLARGGNIGDGARLQEEVIANPAFKSIYGGDGNDLDEIVLDRQTHDVVERRFSVYGIEGRSLQRLATSDIGGANLQLAQH